MRHPVQMALAVLLALALMSGGWLLHSRLEVRRSYEARLANLEKRAVGAEVQAAGLEKDNAALRAQLQERGIEPAVATRPPRTPESDAQHLEAVRELVNVQKALATATQSLTQSHNRIAELEAAVDKLTTDQKQATDKAAEERDDLDRARRVVDAMEGELKSKNERLAQLESSLRKSNDDLSALRQRTSQAGAAANELADINRRRENTLTSLQRRYRDITDQLRSLSVRLESQGAMPELSRIQTAVQSAEEDLRQLSSLSVQAHRATERITGSRAR